MITRRIAIVWMLIAVSAVSAYSEEKGVGKPLTLMGMLSEWTYPKAKFGGAKTSDAGVTGISAIKSDAVLSTKDSPEQVMKHYQKMLNVDANGKSLDEEEGQRITTERSILIQDLSEGRPCKLYLIAINSGKQSTTLVVSRAEGETVTQIAWSDYRQLSP